MSNNIIDKIQLSGVTYDIGGQGGSGVSVVEVTQAEYDALPSSAKTDTSKMYVITDAEAGDLTNYYTKTETNTLLGGKADTATTYTKTEVDNAITAATATKQDTLVSGTNIKTINNTSILGSGNIDIQGGGGGGKTIEAGTNISITTGETADTINCTLPIRTDGNYTGKGIILGNGNSMYSKGASSIVGGANVSASTDAHFSVGLGRWIKLSNEVEFGCGRYSKTNRASSTFGDSGNTLFSVGNGTSNNARHNAFEIRQNGDIYITKDGQDVKLQDQLGGGGGGISSAECQTMINNSISGKADSDDVYTTGQTSGATELATAFAATQPKLSAGTGISIDANNVISATGGGGGGSYTPGDGIDITNDVISVTGKVDTTTYNTYTAATDAALASKQTTLTAGTGISIIDNVISATGGGGGKAVTGGTNISVVTGETADTINCTLPISASTGAYSIMFGQPSSSGDASGSKTITGGQWSKAFSEGAVSIGQMNEARGQWAWAIGNSTKTKGKASFACGERTLAYSNYSFSEGTFTTANTEASHAAGSYTNTKNRSEFSIGEYNNSVSASTTFGDSGNTLFSVGNGTSSSARHNAFEIRQNGDIYYFDGTNDVKLQDKFSSIDTTIGDINTILQSI